jgi:organic hydroperoxide reductase OsmC/OhrA
MQPYPHAYRAAARAGPSGLVPVTSPGLPALSTAPAPQFGGPGTLWSPEALLTAAVANCFVLTFRAVSAAALFGWLELDCQVEGMLARVDRIPQFTKLATLATLTVAPGADAAKAKRLLKKADRACLIANSLRAERTLEARVVSASAGHLSRAAGPPAG